MYLCKGMQVSETLAGLTGKDYMCWLGIMKDITNVRKTDMGKV